MRSAELKDKEQKHPTITFICLMSELITVVRDERCEVEDIDDQWGEEQERARRFFMEQWKSLCDQILKKGGERLEPLNYSTHKDFIDLVKEMKSVITKSEKEKSKFDKDDCIKNIRELEFRQRLYQFRPMHHVNRQATKPASSATGY